LQGSLPRPEAMKPDAWRRSIAARAFDVARYLFFWGVPTNVGRLMVGGRPFAAIAGSAIIKTWR
jgi:hypothetical protein